MDAGYRVGVDIGGTFTDIVLTGPDGAFWTRKVSSTTDDYGRGIVDGLRSLLGELRLDGAEIGEVIHGTTVATNAILEYRGAKTALLTTRGFRDVLELRRVRSPELYNVFYRPPAPMVARRLRLEVDERIAADGTVVRPLDEQSVATALDRFATEGVQAVAVSLIHGYKNPAHERRVGELVRERLPSVFLTLSVDMLPEIREYERTSTTVINAYVGPIVGSYLQSLQRQLADIGVVAPLLIMQSNGGVMTAEAAVVHPAHIVESGPAAGVIAGQRLAHRAEVKDLITFDMGGTTAKASLIERGELTQTTEYEVGAGISLSSRLVKGGGHALKLPVIDIAEVGAGGGSIVWIDKGGALRVGPRSAGAMPGPACYDDGGTDATVTDANVVLGYIGPHELAGGAVRLDPTLAERALREQVAEPLGMGLLEAAHGVYTVAAATMIRAVKAVSTYRGRDPRDFTLLAFGGNGPVFAAEMARALDMRRVLIPPAAGLFSAFGLLEADLERHGVQTFFAPVEDVDVEALNAAYRELEATVRATGGARQGEASPVAPPAIVERFADLRYSGQNYELTVPAPAGRLTSEDVLMLARRFGEEHQRTYGHGADDEPVELVNLRLVARVERAAGPHPSQASPRPVPRGRGGGEREAYFGAGLGLIRAPVLGRDYLAETPRRGPFIVEEYDATIIVPPDCSAWLDGEGNVVIEVGAA
jgi:N-methylhydantoinase A